MRIRARRAPAVASHAIEEFEDLTKAVEIEEVIRSWREIALSWDGIVGSAQGDGGMPPVRESDDEIGIDSPAEPDDLDPLSTERMMRMGDRHESQRWLGRGGSAPRVSRAYRAGAHRSG